MYLLLTLFQHIHKMVCRLGILAQQIVYKNKSGIKQLYIYVDGGLVLLRPLLGLRCLGFAPRSESFAFEPAVQFRSISSLSGLVSLRPSANPQSWSLAFNGNSVFCFRDFITQNKSTPASARSR